MKRNKINHTQYADKPNFTQQLSQVREQISGFVLLIRIKGGTNRVAILSVRRTLVYVSQQKMRVHSPDLTLVVCCY